jgi:hypothetical protein
MQSHLFLVLVALASCAGPPALPPVPPSVPAASPEPGCKDAPALVAKMQAAQADQREDCAFEAAKSAQKLCPRLLGESLAAMTARDEERRKLHGRAWAYGAWFVEQLDGPYEVRVWEREGKGVALRARLDAGDDIVADARGRLRLQASGELVFVEPRQGRVHRLPAQSFLAETKEYVFVRGSEDLRRLRATDLAPAGVVAAPGGLVGRVLHGGDELLAGDALVSFATSSVVRTGVTSTGVRADERRVLACDEEALAIVEADATTGKETARFALPSNVDCHTGAPAYGPDPRFIFWLEAGPETPDRGRRIVVASGDTQTGKIRRFEDRDATWSIAFHSDEHLDADGEHLCAVLASHHSSWTLCEWRLAKDGTPLRDPKREPRPTPSLAALRLTGATELGRAWTPSRNRQLVLSFRTKGQSKRDLRLTVVDARGKIERTVVLEAGDLFFDDRRLPNQDDDASAPLPAIEAIDDDHAVFHEGLGSLEPMTIDLRTGAIERPCHGHERCAVSRRVVSDGEGTVRDIVTGETWTLSASREAWEAAPEIHRPCPEPHDVCPPCTQ